MTCDLCTDDDGKGIHYHYYGKDSKGVRKHFWICEKCKIRLNSEEAHEDE